MSTSPSVPVGKRRPRQQEGHKLLCCGPAGAPARCPRGAVSGRKGHFCAHAHLITGPIWSVPTVKQTPVLEEMDFRRQIHCSHRSPQQLSHANYFPFLVATAKSNCSPRGDSLCRLSVIWKCLTRRPDFKEECFTGESSMGLYLPLTGQVARLQMAAPCSSVWLVRIKLESDLVKF